MNSRLILADFSQALQRLEEALCLPIDSDVIKAGCIQYFEFCFELAWKSVKQVAAEQGLDDCNSPKAALKQAFAAGWVGEEDVWLDMLASRNKMAHTYNASDALDIFAKLHRFLVALRQLEAALKQVD